MILTFQGGSEYAKLEMNRKEKKLVITSSKTGFRPTPTSWNKLFDPGKEEEQEKLTDPLSDEDFKNIIIAGMQQFNYIIKKVEI